MLDGSTFKCASVFAAAAASLLVLGAPDVQAARFISASACFTDTDWITDYHFDLGIANLSPTSGGSGRERRIVCPIKDSSADINTVWIDGYDGNSENHPVGRVRVQACRTAWYGAGMACSASAEMTTGTFTGFFSATLAADGVNLLNDPAKAGWYSNLFMLIPRKGAGGSSQISGYTPQ